MEKNSFSNGDVISPDRSFRYCNGNGNANEISLSRNSTQNGYGRRNFTTPNKFDSPYSNSSSPVDRYNRNSDPRSPRLLFSEDEEEELSVSLKDYYEKDLTALLETSFDRKNYCFNVRGARLPSADKLFTEEKWNNDKLLELQDIKRDLNAVKSKLNEYELTHWHKHTRAMNPADKVMKHLRRDVKVEFLTQAWCKFYELINKYKLIPTEARSSNELLSFHLCEAPGAFVASLNHYLKLNHPDLKWFWKANSLNPYYEGNNLSEMINDDRFMLQTIDCWDFGPDMTGDITHPDYPSYLRENFGDYLPHLVTADGSFDCQDKPEEQESSVSWLHLKETLNALNILRKNGNFVIKMFTFFECDTVCLLTLLAAAFREIKVEKPATSKEGNSECYVVCQEYRGRDAIAPCLNRLLEIDLETYQKYSMFPYGTCNKLFYREISKCASYFAKMQMNVIERNIRIYETDPNDPNLRKHCDFLQEKFVQHYIKKYKLRPIKLEDNIVKLPKFKYQIDRKPPQVIESRDRKQGSHAERVQRSSLVVNDLLRKITEELNDDLCNNLPGHIQLPRAPEIPISAFSIKYGKPIEVVRSSQFCHGRFMRIRNEMIKVYGYRKFMIATTRIGTHEDDFRNYIDFSNLFMKKYYNTAQKESFLMIYDKLSGLREGDYLKLIGLPLLTQFNINVLYVLRQMFRQVMFSAPNVLLLINMELAKFNLWKEKLSHLWEACSSKRAVISFLPISCITGSNNSFYTCLVEANNCRLYHEIDHAIDLRCLRPRT
ncbi:cap-specific mRNA (nucleoside-2'-O-)-methyltransferase 2-like [Planococcus citri]|uniref:cap-specific mRNA (nucleoside-2'-O-)-methyltransferase 2-like n=1 Tax=Planococcus citri TaxID=170843 RepID=UPI0031F7EB4A